MSYIFKTTDVAKSLNLNPPVVYECYDDSTIECFKYKSYNKNWREIISWHQKRHPRPIFCWGDIREVICKKHFQDHEDFLFVPDRLIEHGVDPEQILLVTNYHSLITPSEVCELTQTNMHTIFFRLFEYEAILRHMYNDSNLPDWQGPNQKSNIIPDKKYLCMFGKPRRFMRSGALIFLEEFYMYPDALISALIDPSGLDLTLASNFWPETMLEKVFDKFQGTLDEVDVKFIENSGSYYWGYPYNENLYHRTNISIIGECNDIDIPNEPERSCFYITEKTTRAMYNKHPFVILSVENFMKNLKKLGYKTFDSVIDESYDSITNPYQRLQMAMKSAKDLSQQSDSLAVKQICEHNFENLHLVFKSELKKLKDCLIKLSVK